MQVLGGGNVEVKGARERQLDVGLPGEALHHGAALHPEEGLEGIGPAAAVAEEVQQPVFLLGGVAAALGQDADLAAQRNGMHRGPGALGQPQAGGQLRGRGVGLGPDVQDGEGQLGHGGLRGRRRGFLVHGLAAAADPGEKRGELVAGLLAAVEPPPEAPELADQFVAGVHGDEVAVGLRTALGRDRGSAALRCPGPRGPGRIAGQHGGPGVQRKLGFGGPGGTGVEGDGTVEFGAAEEEGEPTGISSSSHWPGPSSKSGNEKYRSGTERYRRWAVLSVKRR